VKRFCLIANPAAGGGARLAAAQAAVERAGIDAETQPTEAPGSARALARAAASAGAAGVIAYGGDGTLGEVASGLAGTGVPLGILPAGTMNLFAREIGIPARLEDAAVIIAAGRTRPIDLGRVGDRTFILCGGAGLDARLLAAVSPTLKRRLGKFSYYLRAPLEVMRYAYPPIRVVVDGGPTQVATQVILANVRRYGDRYDLAPTAMPDDGLLDACLFLGRGVRDYARYASHLRRGLHLTLDDVTLCKGKSFLLHPADARDRVPFQVDGDYLCDLPVEVEVLASAVSVFAPAETPAQAASPRRTPEPTDDLMVN
jgi:YegS/Rv2252/BmrU family lipid kinase